MSIERTNDAQLTETVSVQLQASTKFGVALLCYGSASAEIAMLTPNEPFVVGRSPAGGLRIDDRSLSREHARFVLHGDRVSIEDLGSKNGTFFHGQRVKVAEVEIGDEVILGAVHVRIQMLGPSGESLGIAGEGVFRRHIDEILSKAHRSGNPFALLLVRRGDPSRSEETRGVWVECVRRSVRPGDRLSWYGSDAVHVLLAGTGIAEANRTASAMIAAAAEARTPICIGIAVYPHSGTTVDVLVTRCVDAAHRASVDKPIQVAPTGNDDAEGAVDEEMIVGMAMRDVVSTAKRVANAKIPVILHGETGTGKEVLARLIHEESPRKDQRIVRVNCAAIPKDLVESTLFGHERGSFTGAVQQHKGVFEEADGGTLFLDEIGELPLSAQAALLRVLETGSISRVGSSREIPVDVRIVTATHRNLETMIKEAAFRADLYYRLAGVVVEIPPLRERKDEIEPLARLFLRMANDTHRRTILDLTANAKRLIQSWVWPGNVRELRNAIERAVVVTRGSLITAEDLPARVRDAPVPEDLPSTPAPEIHSEPALPPESGPEASAARDKVQQYETNLVRETLIAANWNRTEAAAKLKMPVRTLSYRMKVLGIKKPED